MACSTPEDVPHARALADSLGVPFIEPGASGDGAALSLVTERGVLSLRDNRDRRLRPLSADLQSLESASKKQLLGRAVGRRTRTVVDATAGWGEDTRRMCAMGYRVTALERHPVLAALLDNALERARQAGSVNLPRIVAVDAIDYLARNPGGWDCVYLDPMFPPKRRVSTLARRPLRLLRELAGDDPDRQRLFESARIAAAKRVVVKRPDHGEPAFGDPGETVAGKLVCYDLYHVA